MTEYTEKKCPKCEQQLRFPKGVGGVLMACPTCGHKFSSDFKVGNVGKRKLGSVGKRKQRGIGTQLFELPSTLLHYLSRLFTS